MGPDWSQMDMKRKVPAPRLDTVDVSEFGRSIQWMKTRLTERGYLAVSATLDIYPELWNFYAANGDLLIRVPHDYVARVQTKLDQWQLDEDIRRMQETPRGW